MKHKLLICETVRKKGFNKLCFIELSENFATG